MNKRTLAWVKGVVGADEFSADSDILASHAGDKWFAARSPEAVIFPKSVETVSKLMRAAHRRRIPVTVRGAGYGYVGGCVPARGGLVLSLARWNRIKEIHTRDFVAVVEPGVTTQELQDATEKLGLYYPPDPASRADCSIGGNIATNAGGPRCLKYGVTRDYVLGLQVVLADGSVVSLGGRTHKNKTGFELARLFVGCEGMLGVITEATLKLIPLPPYRACLAIGLDSMKAATQTIQSIFAAGFLPSAMELADGFTLAAAARRTGSPLLGECQAQLIVELDGQVGSVKEELKLLERIVAASSPRFIQRGWGVEGCEQFWKLRREFSQALKDTGLIKLNEDVVVPRGSLEELFRFTSKLQRKHKIPVACFGHAGDGNIHVNIMVSPEAAPKPEQKLEVVNELFEKVLSLGGAITGEHGIGLAKKPWWELALPPAARDLHRRIKTALDRNNILNPGKFL